MTSFNQIIFIVIVVDFLLQVRFNLVLVIVLRLKIRCESTDMNKNNIFCQGRKKNQTRNNIGGGDDDADAKFFKIIIIMLVFSATGLCLVYLHI